jgi:P-type E1-E2 ATPase
MSTHAAPELERRPGIDPGQGLSDAEAARRLRERGRPDRRASSRSYVSIVRANVFTVFNVILAAFGVVTLVFGDPRDALFLGVIVANATIGITQEVRAKHALDRLSLLVAPTARVLREGKVRAAAVEEVVVGDTLLLQAGDQVVADGTLREASELRLDESILSGESDTVDHRAGDQIRSGAFVVEGSARMEVEAVGADSFASRLTGQARSFRHPRSPLERAVNRLLYGLVVLVIGLGALLGFSLYHRHVPVHSAVSTATAGVVSLIPEGLVVLMSLTYAAAAVRMSRRGVLAQQLNAIESLAAVDTICVDKTGTLTESGLRVIELLPAGSSSEERLRGALAAIAAGASSRNGTLEAIAAACPAEPVQTLGEIPFASRRRWSAVALADETLYLGAPERVAPDSLADVAEGHRRAGRRVLAVARSPEGLPRDPEALLSEELEPLGIVVLAEELRPGIRETIAFLRSEGIELRVLSGDAPQTAAAIARDVGIAVEEVAQGSEIPDAPEEREAFVATASVVGRISPEGKQAVVEALRRSGRYVAMIGDGVNDVPALKSSRLAIAQGSGTQMARSVADLVLIDGDFAAVPALVAEGRRALRNLQRVTKLYVTKSAFASFLIVTVGTSSEAYPLLPRQMTLAASITIGIPTFFLALAPSSGPWQPGRFVRRVARFAVPAGTIVGTGVLAGYLFSLHDLDRSVDDARTVAVTILVAGGLYLVLALEGEGSRKRSTIVGAMCALLGGAYAVALILPSTRSFFALTPADGGMLATSLVASALTIGALMLCGLTPRPLPGGAAADAP